MTGQKDASADKKTFSAFDFFLVLLMALAVSLAVYFFLEPNHGLPETPVYQLTLRGELADWEENFVPVERQRLLDENGKVAGRVLAVTVISEGLDRTLILNCEWEGDFPAGKTFRLETADLVKIMRITNVTEITGENG